MRYHLPPCLEEVVHEDVYRKWLQRKAQAHVRRDRRRGNKNARVAEYKLAIHKAITRDGPNDWYTGEALSWNQISKYDNAASRSGGRKYKKSFAKLPTVDHEGDGLGKPRFRICGWAVNDAKGDLAVSGFTSLCRKFLECQGYQVRRK
jgi:hypothetical protein